MIDETMRGRRGEEGAPAAERPAAVLPDAGAATGLTDLQRAEIRRLAQRADELVEASLSANTRKAYASAWQQWTTWCLGFDLDPAVRRTPPGWPCTSPPCPKPARCRPSSCAAPPCWRSGAGSAARCISTRDISQSSCRACAGPRVSAQRGRRPCSRRICGRVLVLLDPATAPAPKRCLRDRALLLTGFAGGFRRSELAGFDLRDLTFTAEGLVLFVAGSKNDQERRGEEVGIQAVPRSPLCAVTAVSAWLAARGDAPGPLFCRIDRGGHLTYGLDGRLQPIDTKTVARLVKRVIAGTGLGGRRTSPPTACAPA